MKRTVSVVLTIALVAGIGFALSCCARNSPAEEELSQLVSDAVISDNKSAYLDGECCAEGHRILGSRISGGSLTIYALTTFGNYGFRNEMFIKVSGSGVIPAVLTFEKEGAGYSLQKTQYPRDGSEYVKSIKQMFPLRYRAAALHADTAYEELSAQERIYAEDYLNSIGREAEIGEFRDLNTVLLTDVGISVEVSNQLCCDKRLAAYPYWIGTSETVINGTRYILSLSYNERDGQIIYKTAEKDSGAVKEIFIFDSVTGEELV